jgi:serpin B
MKKVTIIGVLAVCMILTAGVYAGFVYSDIYSHPKKPTPKHIYDLQNAMNTFAFQLYKEIIKETSGNIFFSPYSIYIALAMTFEGAKGSTADQMSNVLGYPQGNETMLSTIHYLWEAYNNHSAINLSTANALWLRDGLVVLDDYIERVSLYFEGNVTNIDFSNPTEAAGIINGWVENHTNGLIKDLVPPAALSPLTQLVLTNAIYFKGAWKVPFNVSDTVMQDFYVTPDVTVKVPMMRLLDSKQKFNFTEDANVSIIELPYGGDTVSMLVILPKNGNLSSVELALSAAQLQAWRDALTPTSIDVYLPRFKLETSYTLNDYLKNLGMANAFSGDADFSGITGDTDMFISAVLHKAYVDVDENGTEAAAATAVIVTMGMNTRPFFNADHPFIFLIQHKETGNILFMGKVTNPLV